jgi:uncharacterized protein YjiS (DUF1127 family)
MPRTIANILHNPLAVLPNTRLSLIDLADLVLSWMEVARQRRHLASLDNRMLRDIGFSQADVDREISRPFWDIGPKGR